MVSLTDNQLRTLMDTAGKLSLERRDVFSQRVGAMLRMRGHFTDADVADVAQLANRWHVHQPAA